MTHFILLLEGIIHSTEDLIHMHTTHIIHHFMETIMTRTIPMEDLTETHITITKLY
jgi:hypothetical protein